MERRATATATICVLLATALLATLAAPAAASPGHEATTTTDTRTSPVCVFISTDPPNAGVATRCSGSGTVNVDGEPVLAPSLA